MCSPVQMETLYTELHQAFMSSIILVVHAYFDIIGSITEVTISGLSNDAPMFNQYMDYKYSRACDISMRVVYMFVLCMCMCVYIALIYLHTPKNINYTYIHQHTLTYTYMYIHLHMYMYTNMYMRFLRHQSLHSSCSGHKTL